MKILLMAINSKFIHSNLAVRYLKAFTKDLDYECTIKEFSINDRIERIFENLIEEKPNIVAFSCYIWNIEYVVKLANLIKTLDKNIEIMFGGPEISFCGEKFLSETPGDYLIKEEGEETFREFVQWKLSKELLDGSQIKGLYCKNQDGISFGGERKPMDLNDTVFPYEKEDDLSNKIVYYESSRGCPFKCKYCLSSTTSGVRFLDAERTKRELQFFIDKGIKLIKFVDRTFNCNHKFSMDIWNFLIHADTDATFHFEISADILIDEEIELLKTAPKGRIQLEVGVQTTNEDTLKNINRNVKFEDIKDKVVKIETNRNVKQHLDLIGGLPGETYLQFKKSFNDVYGIAPEEVQMGFLKLLKGSSMIQETEKWGMVYSPYPPYEIMYTSDMSYEEILKIKKIEEVVDKYYNSQKFGNILKYFVPKFDSPFDFYFALGVYFKDRGYIDRKISSSEYYGVFIDFGKDVLHEDIQNLAEIIKFDYLKFNKKKWLPPFLNRIVEKKIQKEIRDNIKKENPIDFHIERFNIDILKYVTDGEIVSEIKYLVFDEQNPDNIFYYE